MRELGAWSKVVVGHQGSAAAETWRSPRPAIRASLEASLKRLGRADVDVFHLHNPLGLSAQAGQLRWATVLDEVARALRGRHRRRAWCATPASPGWARRRRCDEVVLAEPYRDRADLLQRAQPERGFTGQSRRPAGLRGPHRYGRAARGAGVIVIRVLAAGAAAAAPARATNAGDPGGSLVGGGSYADRPRTRRATSPALAGEARPGKPGRAGDPLRPVQARRVDGPGRLLEPRPPGRRHPLRRTRPADRRRRRARRRLLSDT